MGGWLTEATEIFINFPVATAFMPAELSDYVSGTELIFQAAQRCYLEKAGKGHSLEAYLAACRERNAKGVCWERKEHLTFYLKFTDYQNLLLRKMGAATNSDAQEYLKAAEYLLHQAILCKMIADGNDDNKESEKLRNIMETFVYNPSLDEEFTQATDSMVNWLAESMLG